MTGTVNLIVLAPEVKVKSYMLTAGMAVNNLFFNFDDGRDKKVVKR